jgi:hypothetical protein
MSDLEPLDEELAAAFGIEFIANLIYKSRRAVEIFMAPNERIKIIYNQMGFRLLRREDVRATLKSSEVL